MRKEDDEKREVNSRTGAGTSEGLSTRSSGGSKDGETVSALSPSV